jgi:hypothetical protein
MFLGTENKGDPGFVVAFAGDEGSKLIKADDGLFGLSMGEGAGAEDECAVADGFRESGCFEGFCEEVWSADGGAGFAPVGLVGRDHGKAGEAKVGHGAGDCADVEGIARRDENDGDAVALLWRNQRDDCRACDVSGGELCLNWNGSAFYDRETCPLEILARPFLFIFRGTTVPG